MTARTHTITRKVETEFGSMYIHVELDADLRPVGGSISSPRKEPEAQITRLVETLSHGLDHAMATLREVEEGAES